MKANKKTAYIPRNNFKDMIFQGVVREVVLYFSIVDFKKADICRKVQVAESSVVEESEYVTRCRQKEQSF